MATEAQIQANRANALKSTGPRTAVGRARARLNALKHGVRAQDAPAVLPQEDPAELEARIREWVDDHQPANAIERELVTRAARISWALDRAERHEAALLSRRVRMAMGRRKARLTARACDLGRKLLALAGKRLLPGSGPDWQDDPSAFVAGLEESTEGARWLLDRWTELRLLIDSNQMWTYLDQYKFVRLLGKQPFDAIDDPELNGIFLAWEAVESGWGVRFWEKVKESTPYEDPAFSAWRIWREIVARPADAGAAVALLRSIADREAARLEELLADLDAIEGDDARELAERASFSAGDACERLRRFQTARTRELIKAVETLGRLRKESARPEPRTRTGPAAEPMQTAPNEANLDPVQVSMNEDLAAETPARERTQSAPAPALRVVAPTGDEGAKGTGPRGRGMRPSGLEDQRAAGEAVVRPACDGRSRPCRRRSTGSPG
ncbi:hypothetical protein [Paludisphaera soli]|uniref:hypothetical protein n=1 Tax=Paludisphaera soli TaxID=2712865 RepID=UPI0013EC22AB|nr:hypothetical protein [Paludisphaera soli]